MKYKHLGFLYGLLILGVISACAMAISAILTPFLSPLIVGILLGAALSPLYPRLEKAYDIQSGITFGAKKLLRAGIVCYGSYITLGEIATLGLNGLLVSLIVVSVVFVCAIVIGRMLKLDNEIAMLVGIGSAVCGAAAILALESTLKTHPSKSSVALGFIVIFGLCGMIVLPVVYYSGLLPLNDYQWGIFIGASLHEVANVVGAAAISPESQNVALIVKMTRVVLLVPLLLIISYIMFKLAQERIAHEDSQAKAQNALYIPYFALGFLAVIVCNSVIDFPAIVIESTQFASKLLLVFAMVALGLQIDWQKFISFGAKTFALALTLFIILLCGTYALVYVLF
ncbi:MULTISPECIES: putative sulfate exporter family transporter [Helicobacter]|uniref:Sulfate exporter family transporter n=2 Tax=Helicobacter TaxID=209 RepID=A0ABZ3F224_9HELI|nr:putative sulfate exporter family transporter [Helicobacter rodentium]